MKKTHNFRFLFALLGAVAPLWMCQAQTTFFSDNFSNGSTTNAISMPGGTPAASFTSYDLASTKNALISNSIAPNDLRLALAAATSSGFVEYQALFATNPVSLNVVGDYIEMDVVFTNTTDTIFSGTATGSSLDIGLYNSGSTFGANTNYPVPGGALGNSGLSGTSSSPFATGNCQPWQGYVGQILSNSAPQILTRPIQNGTATTSANQDLLGTGAGTGLYTNPGGTSLFKGANMNLTIPASGPCTLILRISETAVGTLVISNALYQGAGTSGSLIYSQITGGVTNGNNIASAFDGLGIGVRSVSVSTAGGVIPIMDISSISIFGQSTVPTTPPTISQEPVPTFVTTNGSCAMSVTAVGDNVQYQWYRNGAQKLADGGNISGSKTSQLVISPAGTADQFTGANNGYYCICAQGAVPSLNISTTTNTLTLITSTNLTWTDANGNNWDVNNTVNFQDNSGNPSVFNFGDPVTFDDTAGGGIISLAAPYVSPSSITVAGTSPYTIQGSGSIAGPTALNYIGTGHLTFNSANSYTGGTVISNASAYVLLENYAGLGTGPVTLGEAGGQMELTTAGSATVGIQGNLVVADNFTILVDADSTFGGVLLGNISGTSGKTLTFSPGPPNLDTNQWRIRVLGGTTTNNANININDTNLLFASYQASGSQTYNGVLSGLGGFIEKGTTTFLNAPNTFTGGAIPAQGAIGLGVSSVGTWPSLSSGPLGTGPLLLFVDSTSSQAGNGFIFATINNLILGNAIQYSSGTNNLTLDIGGTNNITLTGPFTFYGNDHSVMTAFPTRSLEVTNTGLTTFTGLITDGGSNYNFTLTGSGVTLFNNNEIIGGVTTNIGGTLLVNGSLPGAVIVLTNAASIGTNASATLGGTGVINGAVTIGIGGTLTSGSQTTAGVQNIGTLTVSNSVTFQGGSKAYVLVNKTAGTESFVKVTGSLAYNGTLVATNISGTPVVGDQFTVFTAGGTGNFTNIVGTPGPGLAWAFDQTHGVLSVVSGIAPFTVPPHITSMSILSGTNLVMNGTNAQSGAIYYTLTTTNVQLPLSQWSPVGTNITTAANAFSFTNGVVHPGEPKRFYILSNTNF